MDTTHENQLKDVQKRIIYESIKQVLCIDDEFKGPYADSKDIKDVERDIYEVLTNENKCMVSMVQYEEGINFKEKLEGKDLLILDWELTGISSGCEEALEILYQAVISNIPFLCIYTNEEDEQAIYNDIEDYFLKYTKEDIENYYKSVEDSDEINFYDMRNDFKKFIYLDNKEKKELKQKLFKDLVPKEKCRLPIFEPENMEKISLYLNNRHHRGKGLGKDINVTSLPNLKARQALNLNGKILTVFQKTKIYQEKNTVAPRELIKKYAESYLLSPNSIFSLIGLRYKNTFRKLIYKQGRLLNSISADAFYYHYKQLMQEDDSVNEKEYFQDFLIGLYQSEVGSLLNSNYEMIEDCILEEIKKQSSDRNIKKNDQELMKINYYYSINEMTRGSNRKIAFGDIFEMPENKFLICITPHCQCLRPEKIDYDYLFLFGKLENASTALKAPEEDGNYFSYIKLENEYQAIKWETNKLKVLYIPEGQNVLQEKSPLEIIYRKQDIELKYLCQMKENYAQRLANHAIKQANKVGIVFAKSIGISQNNSTNANLAQQEAAATSR